MFFSVFDGVSGGVPSPARGRGTGDAGAFWFGLRPCLAPEGALAPTQVLVESARLTLQYIGGEKPDHYVDLTFGYQRSRVWASSFVLLPL